MPVPSAFTPCGALECSSRPSHIEEFYTLLPSLFGTELDFSVGTQYDEPHLYAVACMLAIALYEVEHAGNQAYPASVNELLPLLELDFGLIPGPRDTVTMRRAALAAAELLPRGEIASNVTNALRAIFGAGAFKTYEPAPGGPFTSGFGTVPDQFGHPAGFADVRVPTRLVQLVDPVVQTGVPVWVGYRNYDTTVPTPRTLYPNDRLIVGAGNTFSQELVTVVATATTVQAQTTPGFNYFLGTYNNAHGVGSAVVAGNYPYFWSTARLSYVVVTAAAALNVALRNTANGLLAKLARGVEQWAIVQPATTTATGGTVGPLTVGSAMGTVPIGASTYTNAM